MAPRSSKTFQAAGSPGSLSDALRLWQELRAAGREAGAIHLVFSLSCRSESRALRLAGFLRRRRACAVTRVDRMAGPRGQTWEVSGTMHTAIHTLSDLESMWTWLREAADSHQVTLVRVGLDPATA